MRQRQQAEYYLFAVPIYGLHVIKLIYFPKAAPIRVYLPEYMEKLSDDFFILH